MKIIKNAAHRFQAQLKPLHILFGIGFILLLLLARDPFSTRTLIPNLEPFPDTFHYLSPPQCFIEHGSWTLCRPNAPGVKPAVPPVYSLVTAPFTLVGGDVRWFYLANVALSLANLYLLYRLIRQITDNRLLLTTGLLLWVTSYHTYWLPNIAMAENALIPLTLLFLNLLITPVNNKTAMASAITIAALYGTKLAALPLTAAFGLTYFFKLLASRQKLKSVLSFLIPFGITFALFGGFQKLLSLFVTAPANQTSMGTGESWYSLNYLAENVPFYLKTILGQATTFLWDARPISHPIIAISGLFGVSLGMFRSKLRWLSLALFGGLLLSLLVLSTFYTADARYLYPITIITIILGVLIGLRSIERQLQLSKFNPWIIAILCFGFVGLQIITQMSQLKLQLILNFKAAETPWYYVTVQTVDQYFKKQTHTDTPVIITPMPPYLYDYYLETKAIIMPLSPEQDFRGHKKATWGEEYDYSNLINLYQSLMNQGHLVYLSSYGMGNEGYLKYSFNQIQNNFTLKQVTSGCHDLCPLYQLEKDTSDNETN